MVTIIDIGCGRKKIAGSIGIDYSKMSDADIFIDLNTDGLPFEDNSVDFAYSSHTLEHLTKDGFFHIMREVYRVLKPGHQFNLVVPYFSVQSNFANPFHNNDVSFNEHTFRFFSSESETPALEPKDYASPSVPQWGLRYSANFELGMEFRTRRIKFFYYPHVRDLPKEERRDMRSKQLDVVDQIAYWLEVIKPCPIRPETGPVTDGRDPHDFVEEQLSYIKKQIAYILEGAHVPEELDQIQSYVSDMKREGDLITTRGLHTHVNQIVFELDDWIQYLRRFIDNRNAGS